MNQNQMNITKKIVLRFPQTLVDQPIICRLVKDFSLDFNILKASVTSEEEGLLVLELSGTEENYQEGLKFLSEIGVKVQLLSQDITRNEDRCAHCSVCVPLCPSGSFEMDSVTDEVHFHDEKCVACGLCVKICPPGAMEMTL